jgi:signal transduction histidine kinase
MRLFPRTLLFFIGVIAFQSVLTILVITNQTGRSNLDDAARDLEAESTVLWDTFHAWKRQIWISLEVGSDRSIGQLLAGPPGAELDRWLRERLLASKVDTIVLRGPRGVIARIASGGWSAFQLSDLAALQSGRPDPHLCLEAVAGTLCMVGVTPVAGADGSRRELFLLKRLDAEFFGQLVLNRRSDVGLFAGSRYLAGTLPAAPPAGLFEPRAVSGPSVERFDARIGQGRYNASWQRIGPAAEGDELYLGTFVSNAPYDQRLESLDRTILVISAAAALLTVLLGLFLTRNITHPIAQLLAGMDRIRAGAWDTRVRAERPPRGGWEIERLFRAFNEMARDLEANRAATQEHLRETMLLKEYNEKIVDAIRAGIAIVNRDLVVEKANQGFIDCLGLAGADPVGRRLAALSGSIFDEVLVGAVRAILEKRSASWSGLRRSEGGRVYEVRLYPFYSPRGERAEASDCVLVVDDISTRTELEQKILRAEKLATISMLSAGMAHEINNPLGSILTNAQNLIEVERDPERRVALKWIEQEARRIARIVEELLRFAAGDSGRAAGAEGAEGGAAPGCDVNAVVEEVVRLARHSFPSLSAEGRIRIDTRLAPGLPPSVASADGLSQVTINLLSNSVQAIPGTGRILVTTRRSGRSGRICLAVSDTGSGIPPEALPRIFDPFFTTKANGAGTGLGLSVVYGIVTRYNGSISVRSRVGSGTRIAIEIPCIDGGTP